jgi:hypothetical protein
MLSLHSYVLPLHSYMRSFPPAAFHSLLPFTPRLGAKGQPKRAGGEIKPLQKRASPPAPLWFSLCTPFPHPPPPLPVFVWRLCLIWKKLQLSLQLFWYLTIYATHPPQWEGQSRKRSQSTKKRVG